MDSITNLLRALAEAIRPYLGLDDITTPDPRDIVGLDDMVEEAVDTYMSNDSSILTDTSFDPDDYGLITKDDFDPSRYDLLDETDIGYLIEERVDNWVSSWVEDNVVGIDYTSDEFLDAVEKAVRATLAGITFTVQANLNDPDDQIDGEVHLDGHSAVV